MANTAPTEYVDGVTEFSAGVNSGDDPLALPKNQLAYATNATVRGRNVRNRPPFQKQNLILDTGISLQNALFQGACYYQPDFGAESIIAQIGGRLYQFIPDTTTNAYVYDRTVKSYLTGISFNQQTTTTTFTYSVVLTNINDTSGSTYAPGTVISTDPSFITASVADLSMNPVLINDNTQLQWTGKMLLPTNFTGAAPLVGKQVYLQADGVPNQIKWNVINSGVTGSNPYITIQFTFSGSGSTIDEPAGTPVFYINNPSPPGKIAVVGTQFIAPGVGQSVTIALQSAYPGAVGDGLLIGGFVYQVTAIPAPTPITAASGGEQVTQFTSTQFSYDPNPVGVPQVWLWQSENYVIVEDGQSLPIFFNGISSRRAITPSFVGSVTEAFLLPQIAQTVNITLNAPYLDAVGTFINLSPLNFYPFLMEVTAVNVGGNSNVITAANITGQTAVNNTIPLTTPLNSTSTPSYFGVLASGVAPTIMPAPGGTFNVSVSPPFNGSVGDVIILTDGTGPLTSYQATVAAITGGGAGLTLTNDTAPEYLILNVGYPVISSTSAATELPIGRMGAYVQGRNWISSPNGKYFIAGDLVGSSSGTQALNFRDAVLKWSQNTTQFNIPGEAGEINCIVALNTLDASLGQGPLQILCDNDIFTCSAPTDATTWASLTTPILAESVIGFGGTGQNAAIVSNGDLLFKSSDGTIHSLKLARQDFNQWGNLPISQEMNRVVYQENLNQLGYISGDICNNRCLLSCSPIDSAYGIYGQGMIVLDFDVTSSLQGKLPSVYDGVWNGLNVLQIITGKFNKIDRTFVFSVNTTTGLVELWEVLNDGNFDNGTTPIDWSFETPIFFKDPQVKPEFALASLEDGELYLSELVGSATINVWFRPDFDNCWHVWSTATVCADNQTQTNPVLNTAQYRMRVGLGRPQSNDYDPTTNKPARVGRFFQLRVEVIGALSVNSIVLKASSYPETGFARVGGVK